jgi:hypothetical protein
MALDPLISHRVLSLMPTYRCNAACKSCGTLSNPRVHVSLTLNQVTEAIREAKDAGIELVVFTGGEATLEPGLLFPGLQLASDLGMLTRLVTNAHWANTDSEASSFLDRLKAVNLDEINYSTGDQHARFVPVVNVLRAVRAALDVGLTPAVMVETTAVRSVTKDILEQHPYQMETSRRFPGRIVKFNESPWMPLQPHRIESYPAGMAITKENLSRTRGCDSVLQTVTVQADGAIGACCGLGMRLIPELNLGSIGTTSIDAALREGETDLLKRWIRLEGPERILAWAATKDQSIQWEGQYAHRCQACLRLYKDEAVRTVIEKYYMEKMPDVIFGEYLLYHLKSERNSTSNVDDHQGEALS